MVLSKKLIKVLGIALIAIILLGGWFGVGQPLLNQSNTQATELKSAQDSLTAQTTKLAELSNVEANIDVVNQINSDLLNKFPELADVPGLLDSIGNAAAVSGIAAENITQVNFGTPTLVEAAPAAGATEGAAEGTAEGGDTSATPAPAEGADAAVPADGEVVSTSKLANMTVDVTVIGTTAQFQSFLGQLKSMDRGFTIGNFSIAASAEGDSTLTLKGTTFIYSHIATPDETLEGQAPVDDASTGEQAPTLPTN
jgi:Tfp pilus assembly protein PilO